LPTKPDALKSTGMNDVIAYNKEAATNWENTALLACENCGRTFLPERLKIHSKSCTPGSIKTPLSQAIKDSKLGKTLNPKALNGHKAASLS
jgi:hypothetical protein